MSCYFQVCIVYTYHNFMYSFIDRHLGCFHNLTIINNAAISMGVHVSSFEFVFSFSSDGYPGVELMDPTVVFSFWRKLHAVNCWLYQFTFLPLCMRVPFSPHPLAGVAVRVLFDDSCFDMAVLPW